MATNVAADRFTSSVFEEYGQAVLAYARRLTGDHHAAEDVVQEAMIRTWRHAEKLLAEGGSVRRWLMTVVRNIVYDQVRARQGRPVEVEDVRSTAAVTGDHADRVVADLVLVEALRGLPEELRSVVLHVHLRGDSVAETAAELDIPPGTVKSRTHRAMSVLRRRLPPAVGAGRWSPAGAGSGGRRVRGQDARGPGADLIRPR
ncbi:sigma-70 family RNA polymerase sigma factor [Saccharothrix xinjiangensis]|uniref:Sigma-70 family RNA polymerase sigma factor n=1 Tax=Saccharothrix xinjiangensis TaxID=204798 RepID=A0ABV9Y6H4_9PSEU